MSGHANADTICIPEEAFTAQKPKLRCPLCTAVMRTCSQLREHIQQIHKGITASFPSDSKDPLQIELGLKNPGNERVRSVALMLESHGVVCLLLACVRFNGAGPGVAVAMYGIEGEPEYITVATNEQYWVGSPLSTNVDFSQAISHSGTLMTTFAKNPTDFVQEGSDYKLSLKVNLGKLPSPQTAMRRRGASLNLFQLSSP